MIQSKYNVIIPLKNEESLIWNTFSDSRIVVNKKIKKAIEVCNQPHMMDKDCIDLLPQLKELGIIVDNDVNEDRSVEYWFQKAKYDSSMMFVNILTTLSCNMKCVYCFEQGVQSNITMSNDMTQKVCNWLTKKMDEVRPRELTIGFFGGEPLMNPKAVRQLSETLFAESTKRNITFHIEITTNGLLLTQDIVSLLVPLGLRRVKVTLDGDEVCHNRMRPQKNGQGTYQKIINNLQLVKGMVPLVVGGNYDDSTKKYIPALLDDLKALGFVGAIDKMSFKPILGFPGYKKGSAHTIKACSFSDTNVDDIMWAIKEIEKRGFTASKDVALGPCEAMRENSYSVDPSGDIYKCAILSGRKEHSIGNIADNPAEVYFSAQNVSFMTVDLWRKCKDCKFIPICGGGCRNGALSQKADLDAICCEKEYFEKVSMKLIVSEICENN